uniref:Helicase ATP-binding domain-containing protein n=1 Tax=Romanomermis culicivorax TaxID=13658 RepID=A0A915JJA4_ROMCU
MGDEVFAKKKRRSWIENVIRVRSEENAQRCFTISSSLTSGGLLGLPLEIQKIFENNRKIDKLYDWQEKCLKMKSVENGRNLIISLPTGGGKTLVAEIFILKQVVCRQKDALFILPFVSIVQEKIKAFLPLGLECDFLVEEYAANKGRIPPIKHRRKKAVYIATIEKAHSLVNSLIESKTLSSLGLIVIDELHMIGEGYSRGSCLEQIISKVQYVSPSTQLIGISATLNNVDQLKEYMKAELLTDDFRPASHCSEYLSAEAPASGKSSMLFNHQVWGRRLLQKKLMVKRLLMARILIESADSYIMHLISCP